MLIGRILNRHGALVKLVESGQEAIDQALSDKFDVILMDIQMPGLDGYEATRTLRKLDYRAPIVALTAHALKSDRERCLTQGFDGYLTKPIQRQELVSQIAELKGRQTRAGQPS
jgi:CheY-like chemotaxis protein